MSLLKQTRLNHLGKLAFRWVYWNVLIPGRPMPVPPLMSLAGKRTDLLDKPQSAPQPEPVG
jgi:sulfide:quinone oxidoreductase